MKKILVFIDFFLVVRYGFEFVEWLIVVDFNDLIVVYIVILFFYEEILFIDYI